MPSREFELVVRCCVWPRGAAELERIRAVVEAGPLDWELVSRIARRQRVSALVHHALKQMRPGLDWKEPGLEALARDASATMHEGLLLAGESARLLKVFQSAGMEPLFLKGSALSMLAFGSVALRHARDIDLLVDPAQVEAADALLRAEGYELTETQGLRGETLAERMEMHKDFEYRHPVKRVQVELHWRVFALHGLSEGVPEGARQWVAVAAAVRLPTQVDEEMLLYLCAHGSTHAWNRLKWIADVQALLAQRAEGFDGAAAALLARARKSGMAQPVEQALLLSQRLFGRPERMPRVSWRSHVLAEVAMRSMTAGGAVAEPEETAENTLTSMSFLLLRPRLRYFLEAAHFLIYVPHRTMEAPPKRMPRVVYPLWRVYRWVQGKVARPAGAGR